MFVLFDSWIRSLRRKRQVSDLGREIAKYLGMREVNITPIGFVCGISNAVQNDHLVLSYEQIFILVWK